MDVYRVEPDSQVLGRAVLAVGEFDREADFAEFERAYRAAHDPGYAYCKLPVDDIAGANALEAHGFGFIECQLRCSLALKTPFPVENMPYVLERVEAEEDLAEVLEIAGGTFVADRWTTDPLLGAGLPGERYRQYVLKSFRTPGEAVYRLRDAATGETLAFKTHRYVSDTEVLFLLGGVHPAYKKLGIGLASDHFEFNDLIRRGFRRGITHFSAANHPVINLEVGHLGFRVLGARVVLRKVYPSG